MISKCNPNSSFDQQVECRRVQVVTRGALPAAYMLLAVACSLFGAAMSGRLPLWQNLMFFAAFGGLVVCRVAVIGGFRADRADYVATLTQQKYFGIYTLALGICWGSWMVSAWEMPVDAQVIVFSLVTATSFVAVGTLAAYPKWHSFLIGPPLLGLMVMQTLNESFSLFFVTALGVAQIAMANYMLMVHKKAIDNSIRGSLRQALIEQRFEAMFSSETNAILVTKGSEIVRISSPVRELLNLTADSTVYDIRHGLRLKSEHLTRMLERVESRLSKTGLVSANVRFWLPNGRAIWVNIQGRLFDPIDFSQGIVWHLRDSTKRREKQARNEFLAHHDALTNVLNRAGLLEKLAGLTSQSIVGRKAEPFAVLNLDLDGFKAVNDTHGHVIGDAVLRIVSQRLQRTLRSSDFIARTGGDEFIVVLTDTNSAFQVAQATEKIVETLSKPIVVDKRKVEIGVAVGYAIWPTDGSDAETLLRLSDVNMYTAKQASRNAYRRALTGLI